MARDVLPPGRGLVRRHPIRRHPAGLAVKPTHLVLVKFTVPVGVVRLARVLITRRRGAAGEHVAVGQFVARRHFYCHTIAPQLRQPTVHLGPARVAVKAAALVLVELAVAVRVVRLTRVLKDLFGCVALVAVCVLPPWWGLRRR